MSDNPYKITIEVPKSDGFHTRDDRHVAEIVQRRVQDFLDLDRAMGWPGCTVSFHREEAATECRNGSPTCTPEDPCVICYDAEETS